MTRILIATLASLMLTACGGAGSTATMRLMDAPPAGVTAVNVTVKSIEAHVDDKSSSKDGDPADSSIDSDDKWVTLTLNKKIDLVAHQGETAANLLGDLELPPGKVTQVRLQLDTSAAANNTATFNGVVCNLDVTKVEAKGIKINHVFKAFESKDSQKHDVYVDFELDKSMTAKDGCFLLEPKLKLHKVKTDGKDVVI